MLSRGTSATILIFLAVLLLTAEIGYRVGARYTPEAVAKRSDMIQQALLTLLSFLLAFTVAMADSRFEDRSKIMANEANAIGTAYLRTELFPGKLEKTLQSLLREYLDSRILFYLPGKRESPERIRQRTMDLQNRIWSEASQLGTGTPAVTVNLLLGSLNETFDLVTMQEFAYARHVPKSITRLLFVTSVLIMGLIGFGHGLTTTRHVVFTTMLAVVIACTLFVILDLDESEHGWIRVDPQVLIQLKKDIESSGI